MAKTLKFNSPEWRKKYMKPAKKAGTAKKAAAKKPAAKQKAKAKKK